MSSHNHCYSVVSPAPPATLHVSFLLLATETVPHGTFPIKTDVLAAKKLLPLIVSVLPESTWSTEAIWSSQKASIGKNFWAEDCPDTVTNDSVVRANASGHRALHAIVDVGLESTGQLMPPTRTLMVDFDAPKLEPRLVMVPPATPRS